MGSRAQQSCDKDSFLYDNEEITKTKTKTITKCSKAATKGGMPPSHNP